MNTKRDIIDMAARLSDYNLQTLRFIYNNYNRKIYLSKKEINKRYGKYSKGKLIKLILLRVFNKV